MRKSRAIVVFAAILVVSTSVAGAQVQNDTTSISVRTNAEEGIVLIDGREMGAASESPFVVEPGQHRITIQLHGKDGWASRQRDILVSVETGQHQVVHLDLPIRYRIEAFPSEAEVVLTTDGEERYLGKVPVTLEERGALPGSFQVRLDGYEIATVEPGDSLLNRYTVLLNPLSRGTTEEDVHWTSPSKPNRWIDYAAAGVALASAGVAIYYKFEADSFDDRYRDPASPERGNPALREEAERFDRYSLVSLGAMQLAVGFLGIRFILR